MTHVRSLGLYCVTALLTLLSVEQIYKSYGSLDMQNID